MNEVSIIVEKMLKMDGKKAIFRKNPRSPFQKTNKVDRGRK